LSLSLMVVVCATDIVVIIGNGELLLSTLYCFTRFPLTL